MEYPFAFSQCQSAGGQRDTGLRQSSGFRQIFRPWDSVRGQDFVDLLFVSGVNIVKENVTICRQSKRKSKLLGNRPKCGPPLALFGILDPALFDPQGAK